MEIQNNTEEGILRSDLMHIETPPPHTHTQIALFLRDMTVSRFLRIYWSRIYRLWIYFKDPTAFYLLVAIDAFRLYEGIGLDLPMHDIGALVNPGRCLELKV